MTCGRARSLRKRLMRRRPSDAVQAVIDFGIHGDGELLRASRASNHVLLYVFYESRCQAACETRFALLSPGRAAHEGGNDGRDRLAKPVRNRPRPQPGELHAALAAELSGPRRPRLPRPARGHPRPHRKSWARDLCALPPACLGPRRSRDRAQRHRRGDGANIPEMVEAHFGMPMLGAVLNTLNIRLDAEVLAFMLRAWRREGADDRHASFSDTIDGALALLDAPPLVIDIADPRVPGGARLGEIEYEAFLAGGDPGVRVVAARRTSGTRSRSITRRARPATRRAWSPTIAAPYLNAVSKRRLLFDAAAPGLSVDAADVPLQRLVLSVDGGASRAARNVCLRRVEAEAVFVADPRRARDASVRRADRVRTLVNAPDELARRHRARGQRPGCRRARRPMAMIEGAERMSASTITHVYGLTETYGPAAVCAMHAEWGERSRARAGAASTRARGCLSVAGGDGGARSRRRCRRCRATARRSARSCSAATSR